MALSLFPPAIVEGLLENQVRTLTMEDKIITSPGRTEEKMLEKEKSGE